MDNAPMEPDLIFPDQDVDTLPFHPLVFAHTDQHSMDEDLAAAGSLFPQTAYSFSPYPQPREYSSFNAYLHPACMECPAKRGQMRSFPLKHPLPTPLKDSLPLHLLSSKATLGAYLLDCLKARAGKYILAKNLVCDGGEGEVPRCARKKEAVDAFSKGLCPISPKLDHINDWFYS